MRGHMYSDIKSVLEDNYELIWKEFLEQYRKHKVQMEWIKGHNQHPQNESCDKMAVEASKKTESQIEDVGYQQKE